MPRNQGGSRSRATSGGVCLEVAATITSARNKLQPKKDEELSHFATTLARVLLERDAPVEITK
jgi:hypothetical protein